MGLCLAALPVTSLAASSVTDFYHLLGKPVNAVTSEILDQSCLTTKVWGAAEVPTAPKRAIRKTIHSTNDLLSAIDIGRSINFVEDRYHHINFRQQIVDDYIAASHPAATVMSLVVPGRAFMMDQSGPEVPSELDAPSEKLLVDRELQQFRSLCGDERLRKYVLGRRLVAIATAESDHKTREERESTALKFSTALTEGGQVLQAFLADHSQYEFSLNVYLYANQDYDSPWTMENFSERLYDFDVNGEEKNTVLFIDSDGYSGSLELMINWAYYDLFPDVRPAKARVSEWQEFMDRYHGSRCSSDASAERQALCQLTRNKFDAMLSNCADMSTWDSCIAPNDKACTLDDGSYCDALSLVEKIEIEQGCKAECKEDTQDDPTPTPVTPTDDSASAGSTGLLGLLLLVFGGIRLRRQN
ncbi:hypothetical protein [Vibrio sp. SCSIO 43136]|uniref:hypothetical protein n=1 Tax=Vibrio sp. SCSIO 43136 TaxID=2819101 RepID=UPI0020756382|nr:hypothetical protein [Vibrio sp. SCSIO 43136]USD66140.1 hypothetical protein J4N39_04825 [Vibrio sp. SCSIO 43136]